MSGTVTASYSVGKLMDANSLPPDNWLLNGSPCAWNVQGGVYQSGGLPCDGTVYVSSTDTVSFGALTYTISGTGEYDGTFEQEIMNIPSADTNRTNLYFTYIVNNQIEQITGSPPSSLSITGS